MKTTTMNTIKLLSLLFVSSLMTFSCSNDDDNPDPVNEEEVITTLTATLTPNGGGTAVTLTFRDLDGDGPDAPVYEISGALTADTTYSGSLDLLNEAESPAESITAEIQEEDEDHQFFFTSTNSVASFTYGDTDGNGNPVGLSFNMTASSTAGTGTITVILRHEPNKAAEGVTSGDITNAGGETDISVTFNVEVQ